MLVAVEHVETGAGGRQQDAIARHGESGGLAHRIGHLSGMDDGHAARQRERVDRGDLTAGGIGKLVVERAQPQAEAPRPPAFFDMPEIITNLNATGRRPVFVKLRSKLEIARAEDSAAIQAAMPRLLDLFQTYLRETRPEELRGSAGTHRLREELIARANIAVAPPAGSTQPAPRVTDVLFVEILIQ